MLIPMPNGFFSPLILVTHHEKSFFLGKRMNCLLSMILLVSAYNLYVKEACINHAILLLGINMGCSLTLIY